MMGNIANVRLQTLRKDGQKDRTWIVYLQMVGVLIFSFLLHLPFYFNIDWQNSKNDTQIANLTNYDTINDVDDEESTLHDLWIIYISIYVISIKVVPVIVVVILNIVLIKRLRLVWRRRKRITQEAPVSKNVSKINCPKIKQ